MMYIDDLQAEDLKDLLNDSFERIYSICEVLRLACRASDEDSANVGKSVYPTTIIHLLDLINDELDASRSYLYDAGFKLQALL